MNRHTFKDVATSKRASLAHDLDEDDDDDEEGNLASASSRGTLHEDVEEEDETADLKVCCVV